MNWWRAHHGISSDSKLAAVAIRAKAKRAEVLAVWVCLLDYASQNDKRGNVSDLQAEDIAAQLELSEDLVARIMGAMRARKMILEAGMIAAWESRNPAKTDDTNAERQRRYREAHRDVTAVTPQSNGVTALRNPEENRVEEKESSSARVCPVTPVPEWAALAAAVRSHYPETDDMFVMRLAQACCSVAAGAGKDCTDALAAEAVEHCRRNSNGSQKGAGLFLKTVPQTVKSWLVNGKGPKPERKRSLSEIVREA